MSTLDKEALIEPIIKGIQEICIMADAINASEREAERMLAQAALRALVEALPHALLGNDPEFIAVVFQWSEQDAYYRQLKEFARE